MCPFRSDKDFVSVSCKVRQKSDRCFFLSNDTPTILLLSFDNVLEQRSSCFVEVALACSCFRLDYLENEICGVNLAVRMWIGDPDDFTLVLEYKHVFNLG